VTVSRSQLVAAGVAVAAAALTYLLLLKPPPEPAELIRQRAIQMAAAAEKKDMGFIMEQISSRFRSEEGWGRDELRAYLAAQVLRGETRRVFTSDLETRMAGPTTVQLTGKYIFVRSDAKQLKDVARDTVIGSYQIDARAEKEADGEWRFVWAAHRPVDLTEHL
jgi:hypothetical protein